MLGLSDEGLFGNESAETVALFAEQTGITFPILLGDATRGLYAPSDASISPFPFDVILDKTGTIRYLRREFDPDAMVATVELLLAE